jgi:hypothetical protein
MNKELVLPEQSLELKELGFDKPCFGYYQQEWHDDGMTELEPSLQMIISKQHQHAYQICTAPTFSQAFRWFIEKYKLDCLFEDNLVEDENGEEVEMWDFFIYKTRQKVDNKVMEFCSNNFNTYTECFSKEEAELECLKKLIELVKNK